MKKETLIRLIYLSQGKGDNSRNPECGKIGPTQGRAGIFLFFKLTSQYHNIFTLFIFRLKDIIDIIEMLN